MSRALELGASTGSADSLLERACKPEIGDRFVNYGCTCEVQYVGEYLIDMRFTYADGEWYESCRNIAQWPGHVRTTLRNGARFLPNDEADPARRTAKNRL